MQKIFLYLSIFLIIILAILSSIYIFQKNKKSTTYQNPALNSQLSNYNCPTLNPENPFNANLLKTLSTIKRGALSSSILTNEHRGTLTYILNTPSSFQIKIQTSQGQIVPYYYSKESFSQILVFKRNSNTEIDVPITDQTHGPYRMC